MRIYVDNSRRIKLGRAMGWALSLGVLLLIVCGTRETYSQWAKHSFTHDGTSRDYWVFLPHNFQPKMPVVFSLHGYECSFEFHRDYTLMHEVADTAGFVLVCPMGVDLRWNSGAESPRHTWHGDDVGFISRIVDTLHARYDVDLERIYCCGFSMGGAMTYRLACELGERFAAVVSVAGCLSPIAVDLSWHPIRPMSLMHIHGTLDTEVPYEGNRPGWNTWSVPATLEYWMQRNGCTSGPDTVLLPDLDSSDHTRVEKISFTNCAGGAEIIHYRIIGGGHTWPGSVMSFPEGFPTEGNKAGDISANIVIWDFFKAQVNPLVNMAFGKRVDVHPLFVSPQGDSLCITGVTANPESHPVRMYALVEGIATAYSDSVALYDDGQHSDGEAGDNVCGAALMASRVVEDTYNVTLITYDDSLRLRHRVYRPAIFTTTGPVLPDGERAVVGVRYDVLNGWQYFKLVLRNYGASISIDNLRAGTSCNDPRIYLMIPSVAFGDPIPAGGGDSSETELCFEYAVGYGPDSLATKPAEFTVTVYNGEYPFWTGKFLFAGTITGVIEMDTETGLPAAFALEQNYPNPFNPSTTIRYGLPTRTHVTLTVFNTLGQQVATLVEGEMEAGFHEAVFDASGLASGVYLYRLQAGDFVQTKRLLFLR